MRSKDVSRVLQGAALILEQLAREASQSSGGLSSVRVSSQNFVKDGIKTSLPASSSWGKDVAKNDTKTWHNTLDNASLRLSSAENLDKETLTTVGDPSNGPFPNPCPGRSDEEDGSEAIKDQHSYPQGTQSIAPSVSATAAQTASISSPSVEVHLMEQPKEYPPEVDERTDVASHKQMTANRKEQAVPSTPFSRVLGFGGLAARLAFNGMYETVRRSIGGSNDDQRDEAGNKKPYRALMSDSNAERIAETLCKMRGAALKIGQMLSIQDEGLLPEPLVKALERVRQGADMMPRAQLYSQLERELGNDWRSRLSEFEEVPVAAASIGQVHRGKTLGGRLVAIKVQYPGVANSIESDLKNLKTLVTYMNVLPPGLYVDEIIDVAREELTVECDYVREAQSQQRFRELIMKDRDLCGHVYVPEVIGELSSRQVLTSEWVDGEPIDRVAQLPQDMRNRVARSVLLLTIRELFTWRFMQTDPNWANFLFDRSKSRLNLLDFGASREYDKSFVDQYLTLVWSAANRETHSLMTVSHDLGFLTGDESKQMLMAHEQAGLVVGEPFVDEKPFDFYGSNMTVRISQYGNTFMKHRLTPPPREAYSLHRKLAGAFLICIKLRAVIPCREILEETYESYPWNKPPGEDADMALASLAGK